MISLVIIFGPSAVRLHMAVAAALLVCGVAAGVLSVEPQTASRLCQDADRSDHPGGPAAGRGRRGQTRVQRSVVFSRDTVAGTDAAGKAFEQVIVSDATHGC